MADLTITIPTPVLVGSQTFKVEYSTDGTSYTLWGSETNAAFTVTGLTAGVLYYFRFTLVRSTSPLVECDPVIKTYTIPEESPCVTVEGDLEAVGDVWELTLTFTLPSPYVNPCGGYRLEYGISPNFNSINIPTFITSPSINPLVLPASNGVYTVNIYAVDCSGNETLCDDLTVNPTVPTCEHAVLSSATMEFVGGLYRIALEVTPSIPASSNYIVSYQQANAVSSGVPDPGGTVSLQVTGGSPETFYIPVNPNMNVYGNAITYVGTLTDRCNYSSVFDISIIIT